MRLSCRGLLAPCRVRCFVGLPPKPVWGGHSCHTLWLKLMYASPRELENIVFFLKDYLRGNNLDPSVPENEHHLVRFTFADGRQWRDHTGEVYIRWAHELKNRGLSSVVIADIDRDTQYEQEFYCIHADFCSLWRIEVNSLEQTEDIGKEDWCGKRYLCEYKEQKLPQEAAPGEFSNPSGALLGTVAKIREIALADKLRYYDYCGGPEHILEPLARVESAFADAAKPFVVNPPEIISRAPRHAQNLYMAVAAATWFDQMMDSRNENLPANLFKVCDDVFSEFRFQTSRVFRYMLNAV